MADAWGGSWGNPSSWGVSWGTGAVAPAVAAAVQESLIGGKKAKKRQPWPVFDDDDYDEVRKVKPVVVSNIVKPKDDELARLNAQIKVATAQRKALAAELRHAREVQQLTLVGIVKIAELRHARAQLDAEIERLKQQQKTRRRILQELSSIEQEEEDLRTIAFIVSDLYH